MTKFKKSIFILLLAFFASNCTEDPIEHNRPPSGFNYVPLSVEEARDYFESHAECLEGLYFREKPSTKNTDWKLQLSPRWEDAAVRTLDSSSMVELPLSANAWLIAKRNIVKGESRASDVTTGFRKLVIRERKNGSMQQFLITVIPTGSKAGWFIAHPEKFNFFGGEGFNGYVFCSTLEGKFTGVYEYVDGVRYRRRLELNTEIPVQTKGAVAEYPEEGEYATISMFNAPMEDSDNIPESPDGEKPSGCNHHDIYDPNCPYCLDEVPVIGSKCHECGKAICVCCSFCGRYPCQCPPPDPGAFPEPVPCWNCGDIHCDGECYIHGGPSQDDDNEEEKNYKQGLEAINKIKTDLNSGNVIIQKVEITSTGEALLNAAGAGVNANGIITSCTDFLKNLGKDEKLIRNFGKSVGGIGTALGGLQTFIGFTDGDINTADILNAVSTVLGGCALLATGPIAGVLGVTGCVIGLVSSFFSEAMLLEIEFENGSHAYIYISGQLSIPYTNA